MKLARALAVIAFLIAPALASAKLTVQPIVNESIKSWGAWSSAELFPFWSKTLFEVTHTGKYDITFDLTPKKGYESSAIDLLHNSITSLYTGGFASYTNFDLGSSRYHRTFTLDLQPGIYSYYLAFTNQDLWKGTINVSAGLHTPAVPEPETYVLMGIGLSVILLRHRKPR
ncbi:PEP-CTERM sorting domain-containing protein [Paludibacterium paludis]|uniref:Ice-binding protein C-terminal domain-containing protein n=1 Tax=Paludibacterium paludis TaxID=1225769 RepID=A0A918P1X5_9NEIS|nr:PEP-CTERM sorting domain-containing protein [Paludibacterium paludis]GGY13230.1 hypothetical protein GCM10011289_15610 [Paludibacterium paludis]